MSPGPTPCRGSTDADGFYRVSQWELVTGWVGGFEPVEPDPAGLTRTARWHFEQDLLAALARPPCVVAFSGGRDSSAILCLATHLARREGLPDPVPATHDFKGLGAADESSWQELVVGHLGLRDWIRSEDADAFDVLGRHARAGLSRYGLLWPALVHCHAPFVELARGGSLVIGEGGDELMGEQRVSAFNYVLRTRRRPDRVIARKMAYGLAPSPLRRRLRSLQTGSANPHPWLAPPLAEAFARQDAADFAGAPLRWDRAVLRHLGRRSALTGNTNTARVAAEGDVELHVPFLGRAFATAWAHEGGPLGYVTRTGMMLRLFGDVVPGEVCRRETKARFGAVAVGRESRAFLEHWHGEGVDTELVDVEALRTACQAERPLFGTQMLLQAAWLAVAGKSQGTAGPEGATGCSGGTTAMSARGPRP